MPCLFATAAPIQESVMWGAGKVLGRNIVSVMPKLEDMEFDGEESDGTP